MKMSAYNNIDEYISSFPVEVQKNLQKIRTTIQKTAPDASEKISYGIPTFTYYGNLVHFAAYDTHYALYPGAGPIQELEEELKAYDTAKGTIRFPLDKPLPLDLIKKVTLFAIEHNSKKKV